MKRYTRLCHLPQKDAPSVREAFTRKLQNVPQALRKTLMYDQDKEMAEHATLAAELGLKIFFATHTAPGNAAPARAKTGAFAITCPKAPTSP